MDRAVYQDRFAQVIQYTNQLINKMGWKSSDIPSEIKAILKISVNVTGWDVGLFYNDLIFELFECKTIRDWQHDIIKWQITWLRGAGIDDSLSDPPALRNVENEYNAYMRYHSRVMGREIKA